MIPAACRDIAEGILQFAAQKYSAGNYGGKMLKDKLVIFSISIVHSTILHVILRNPFLPHSCTSNIIFFWFDILWSSFHLAKGPELKHKGKNDKNYSLESEWTSDDRWAKLSKKYIDNLFLLLQSKVVRPSTEIEDLVIITCHLVCLFSNKNVMFFELVNGFFRLIGLVNTCFQS